jgi:alkylation response protein AidB-like acyl-CoA dehydrogenase
VDLILSEARQLAIKELYPTQQPGDREGCRLENGEVKVPESFHRAFDLIKEGEWIALTEDVKWNGQGMPRALALAAGDYFNGANFAFMMYPGLTHGAGKLVETFGTEAQKELFLKKMYSGQWTGTMLLTESEAGSDVGALTATAVPNDDGTYSITGEKIFISSGEHDLAENIIHPVLARIEDAPEGTKGISLFLVPKIWVNEDGSLGERNDIVCTALEEKLGIHGNATCAMTLGAKGTCRAQLLGEPNKGMRAMFVMMNEARLLVGLQAFACASASYLHALNYARQRIQGKHLLRAMDKEAPAVPIIQHPDVRRQLMIMKSYVEAMRSLIYYTGYLDDLGETTADEAEKAKYQGMVDVLIPIVKGYVSDRSFEICSHGLQVFGGYGYIKDYPMEQLLRDCRITMIYEGTNGIQAMDLLGRKLGMNKGKPIMDLMGAINMTIAEAKAFDSLNEHALKLEAALNRLAEAAMQMGQTAMSAKVLQAFAYAHPFMEASGDVMLAWMMLWRGVLAARKLADGPRKKDQLFYEGQMKSVDFFIRTVLPVTMGKMDAIMSPSDAAIEIDEKAFGGR